MDEFKEFQGQSLDDAIQEACTYFDASREKLEIDIIQDSKSGIFGLVGARKAKVKARRVQWNTAMEDILSQGPPDTLGDSDRTDTVRGGGQAVQGKGRQRDEAKPRKQRTGHTPKQTPVPAPSKLIPPSVQATPLPIDSSAAPTPAAFSAPPLSETPRLAEKNVDDGAATEISSAHRHSGRGRPRLASSIVPYGPTADHTDPEALPLENFGDDMGEGLQHIPVEQLDIERLHSLSAEVVSRIMEPIVGKIPLHVSLEDGRVNIRMDCGEDSGLIIGREGLTLAALQYLASRMVSRGMNAAVRVQLDAGEYRSRQDEKLREIALSLAERVRATGKPHSTRPLTSYHRRIVHMVLQDEPDVQTRSSGEGPLKRVVVQRRKH